MKLFVESSAIFAERSGIGQFTKRLLEAYHQEYPKQHIRLFGFRLFYRKFTDPILRDGILSYRLIRWLPGKIYTGLFKHNVNFPIDILAGASRKDIVLFPNFVQWPLLPDKRSICIVHDLSYVHYGQYTSPANREYMERYVPSSIVKATHIVTISENSKKEIMDFYKVPEEKISIVYPFIDTDFFSRKPVLEVTKIREKYNLPNKYLLFVSSLEPRKNVAGIIRAYEALNPKLQEEYGLVLAGGKGWLNDDILAYIETLINEGLNIIRTGYVPDEDLPAMFTGASVFVFPSFYEGFGIPPLEAMACGVPVITSNASSLPEVVGDAAIQVDPNSKAELVAGITKILTNKPYASKLIAKGKKRITLFSPQASAKQLQTVLDLVEKR